MSREDELVNALIEADRGIDSWESTYEPEAHYSHFGTRGVVDLYIQQSLQTGKRRDHIYEIKSDSAVKNSSGANEIIRQYNRMREGFYKDESRGRPRQIIMELAFTVTPVAVYHVVENFQMYVSADEVDVTPSTKLANADSKIVFRTAEHPHWSLELVNKDGEQAQSLEEWVEYLKSINQPEGGPVNRLEAILNNKDELDLV